MLSDNDYETDLTQRGSYDNRIKLPNVDQVISQFDKMFSDKETLGEPSSIHGDNFLRSSVKKIGPRFADEIYIRAAKVYGIPLDWDIKRLVKFVHDTYHVSKSDLI